MSNFSSFGSRLFFQQLDRRTLLTGMFIGSIGLGLGHSFAQSPSILKRNAIAKSENDPAELQVLRDAVAALKAKDGATPAIDGWIAVSNPHVRNCFTGDSREIHFGWWFLPWHRAYLIALERRLQHVVSEPKLRLPYWNWFDVDNIPEAFARETYTLSGGVVRPNPLFDATRAKGPADRSGFFRGQHGVRITRVVRGNHDTELDLLRPARFADIGGSSVGNSAGAIESGPHNSIHGWVGGSHAVIPGRLGGNMGQEYSPRDPVFFLHHGNIDRVWEVWLSLDTGGSHDNPNDQNWLQRQFPMPHHTGIGEESYKISDLLETSAWGYNDKEESIAIASAASSNGVAASASSASYIMNDQPLDLSGGIARTPSRQKAVGPVAAANTAPQAGILRLRVTIPPGNIVFSVYLNTPDDQTTSEANLVGIATIQDPTGRRLDNRKEVGLVLPVPDRVLKIINKRKEFSFSVVASSDKGEGPAAAAGAFDGASILELKLDLE